MRRKFSLHSLPHTIYWTLHRIDHSRRPKMFCCAVICPNRLSVNSNTKWKSVIHVCILTNFRNKASFQIDCGSLSIVSGTVEILEILKLKKKKILNWSKRMTATFSGIFFGMSISVIYPYFLHWYGHFCYWPKLTIRTSVFEKKYWSKKYLNHSFIVCHFWPGILHFIQYFSHFQVMLILSSNIDIF